MDIAESPGRHAFLCYARDDAWAVDRLQAALEEAGVQVWRDTEALWPGEDWREKVRAAITRNALVFVACFSARSLARKRSYQLEELRLAIDEFRMRRPDVPWLIPVRLDECVMPDWDLGGGKTLASLQRADVYGEGADQELARLVTAVARILASRRGSVPLDRTQNRSGAERQRSAYLEQVRRIAPPDPPGLLGREAELAELAAFCLEPERGPYVWWQAEAWAGKSALLSSFVLRPPAEVADRVRIVSFFITGRLAAQDTREAFTQVLLEQLVLLAGQDMPSALPESTRDAHLLDMLAQAATACSRSRRRLVLVVDGLDEDRSSAAGPHAHSIASLLPADPPPGMRVIVASRPNPPLPDDVPGWHPLRDPAVGRLLEESPHAIDIGRLARQELQHLLHGRQADQDLLGLLTAARGGLSALDLEQLTGLPQWEIERVLHSASGRTFARRPGVWKEGPEHEVYLLGHEELQVAAERYFGAGRIADYRDKLHEWAAFYEQQAWPKATPEYLLRGYLGMLTATGDLPRIVGCATSRTRHGRMLSLSGGDAAALAEIMTALNLIASTSTPDIAASLRLARYRDYLTDRNARLPADLPAAFAAMGRYGHADSIALSMKSPDIRAVALAAVARAIADQGHIARAAETASQAQAAAALVLEPDRKCLAQAQIAIAMAAAGRASDARLLADQATASARLIADPYWLDRAKAEIAEALTRTGRAEEGREAAASIADQNLRGWAYSRYAVACAEAGLVDRVTEAISYATPASRSSSDPFQRVTAMANSADALARIGQAEQAGSMAALAEAAARRIRAPLLQVRALTSAASAHQQAGRTESARRVAVDAASIARSAVPLNQRAAALASAAAALARTGLTQEAERTATEAKFTARSHTGQEQRILALVIGASALADGQYFQQADTLAASINSPADKTQAIAAIAEAHARAGHIEQIAELGPLMAVKSSPITEILIPLPELGSPIIIKLPIIQDLFPRQHDRTGDLRFPQNRSRRAFIISPDDGAITLTRTITDRYQARADSHSALAIAIAEGAFALATLGHESRASAAISQALSAAEISRNPGTRAQVQAMCASALARIGRIEDATEKTDSAKRLAQSARYPDQQARALASLAGALAEIDATRMKSRNANLAKAEDAEAVARSIAVPRWRALALASIANAYAFAQIPSRSREAANQARETAATITSPDGRATALAEIAVTMATARQRTLTTAISHDAKAIALSIADPIRRATALSAVARAFLANGDTRQASQMIAAACVTGRWTQIIRVAIQLDHTNARVLNDK